ncbi:hypothetical protein V5094_01890 [Moellerella wisconsensis]|uniref:hypothetical protein n=1 Tax=Moellerella wisconsensis TaxID=158849 RepID=UPI0030764AD2
MINKSIFPPYLPQMDDGVINLNDIEISGKIYVEILKYENAKEGDEIRLYFGNFEPYFILIKDPLTDFPIILSLDEKKIIDGRYLVKYTAIDIAENVSYSPISWAIIDRYNQGVLPPPIFIDANSSNVIIQESIDLNNGTHIHISAYPNISINEVIDIMYWTLDNNENIVPGTQYNISHRILQSDISDGFDILVPKAYLTIINSGKCQSRYVVNRVQRQTEWSQIGHALLNLKPIEVLPPPIFIDNIDGWLTLNEVKNGVRVRASYPKIMLNDNIKLFIYGFDTQGQSVSGINLSQNEIINANHINNGYFDIIFPKNIAILLGTGRFDSYYTVTNATTASSYFGTVNVDINNKILPPPTFTQAINGILLLNDIIENNGAIIQVKYNNLILNDSVIIHVSGKDKDNLPILESNWKIYHNIFTKNIIDGFINVTLPLNNVILVGNEGVLFAFYSVAYANSQGFNYSEVSDVKLNMIKKPDLKISLTTGAPPHDYHATHVYPFNYGVLSGTPGANIIMSCSRPAEFAESGSSDYKVTLNESGIARFKLRSPLSGVVTVDGFVQSNPSIEASAVTQFKSYYGQQGKFIAWASSTNALADGVMPCSLYLITDIESALKRPITLVRVAVSGSTKIVGYLSQIADILLNEDQSAQIDLVNTVIEDVVVILTLPESSGSIISTNVFFK